MNGDKPKYRVPSMKEVEAIPWNGYNVVSTFSGGGGSCLGYRMAGYHVIWASEFVEEAQKTYALNHKDTILDPRDIRTVEPEEILSAIGMKAGQIDLFDGSPPCCAFSTAGRREKAWGQYREYSDDKVQKIEDLFFEYIRILNGLKPKCFVAENVSGLVKGVAIGYFKEFLTAMKNCGYNVKAHLLNSKWLGVPQGRQRIIFIGVRNDLGIESPEVKPLPYFYTLKDALSGVQNDPEEVARLVDDTLNSSSGKLLVQLPHNPKKVMYGSDITGGSGFSIQRCSMYKPAPTIMASGGSLGLAGHPLEDRRFTIPELKRITSIPDDFELTGSYSQQYERLGRMVPPVMMMHVAKTVQTEVLDKLRR